MKGELSFEELEARMEEVAAKVPELKKSPEWKALKAEIRKAKKKGAKVMTGEVLAATGDLESALIEHALSKVLPGVPPIIMPC